MLCIVNGNANANGNLRRVDQMYADLNGASVVFIWQNLHAIRKFDPLSFLMLFLA